MQSAGVTRPLVDAARSVSSHGLPQREPPSLGIDLGSVFRTYTQLADEVVAEVPAGARGHKILDAVTHKTVGSQAALAEQIGVDPSLLVHILDGLEQAGLVKRWPDPEDRRNRRVVPTGKGCELKASIESRLRAAEDQLLRGLPATEQIVFRKLLARLAKRTRTDETGVAGR
jgi:DNA-binding MarR family transcriptional regulator